MNDKKEKRLGEKFDAKFGEYFNIRDEVRPVGSRRFIDRILELRLNPNYAFGVELKHEYHKQGNNIESWLRQAEDYARMNYIIQGVERKIPILIYPALSSLFIQKDFNSEMMPIAVEVRGEKYYKAFHHELHEHSNVNAFPSMLGVGEIRQIDLNGQIGYAFIFKNKILWFEKMFPQQHIVNYKHYFPF